MFGRLTKIPGMIRWRNRSKPPKDEPTTKVWYPIEDSDGLVVWLRTPWGSLWGVEKKCLELAEDIGPADCSF